jgi:lipopolysaccharide heptosyltransferase I
VKILIVKPSSLGDVIHALPTVNLLRRHFFHAKISWLINDTFADILSECPVVDEVIPFRRKRWGQPHRVGEFIGFLRELRGRKYDLVVDLQGLFRSGIVTRATGAKQRVGLSDAREGAKHFYTETVKIPTPHMHAVDRYLLAAQHLNAGREPVQFPLGHPKPAQEAVDKLLGGDARFIAVNPTARWASKLWGEQSFAELASIVVKEFPETKVIFIGGNEDRARVESVARASRLRDDQFINAAGRTSLSELTELLRRCAALVTNDSGPMHIAAAVGTPVVALFGATDPALTGPYLHGGIHHKVLRSGIPCSPCLKPHCHHKPRMECMTKITPNEVMKELHSALKGHHVAP